MVCVFNGVCYLLVVLKLISALNILDTDDLLNLDPISTTSILTLFNMTRKVGSDNSKLTREIINDFFKYIAPLNWGVQEISFEKSGHNFTNVIATLPYYNDVSIPNSIFTSNSCSSATLKKDLILAVHYDTIFKIPEFVGAIDSAASMAILLHIVYAFSHSHINDSILRTHNLKIIFFDGEEAFDTWSSTDSLYGSKHLAQSFFKEDVELFVLLDLIGAKETETTNDYKIYNFDRATEKYHQQLLQLEKKLYATNSKPLFDERYVGDSYVIDDDHVPFKNLGIPCLHLFPLPIPSFWHTQEDDFNHLDIDVIQKVSQILLNFAEEFLY